MTIKIKTNNVPRHTLDAYQLTQEEKNELDYIDFSNDADPDNTSGPFFRYKGNIYDVSQATRLDDNEHFPGWQGSYGQSYFHGVIVKFPDGNTDSVIVGMYFQ